MKTSLTVAAVLLSACTSTTSEPEPSDTTDQFADFETGLSTLSLEHDGESRESLLYVPASYDGTTAVPVMLNFHGFGGESASFMEWADMRELSERDGFLLLYPQGTLLEGYSHWNPGLDTEENKSDADDFGFFEALLDQLAATHNIDAARVYASGYSNGASFAYALACYHSDRIAAVGSVSGTMLEETGANCAATHPTAIINIHGTADYVHPYDGVEGLMSAPAVVAWWATHNNIADAPATNQVEDGAVTIEQSLYEGGEGGTVVAHYKVVGGDHVWFDMDYDGANTSDLIWDFVSRFDTQGAR